MVGGKNLSIVDLNGYREKLASETKRIVGDRLANIVAVDHGGFKQLRINQTFLGFPDRDLKPGDEYENFRYAGVIWPYPLPDKNLFDGLRKVRGYDIKLDPRPILIIADDVATSPRPTTVMSALKYTLENLRNYFETAYVSVTIDESGFPNMSAVRLAEPLGPIDYMKANERELYDYLKTNEYLKHIGSETSSYNDSYVPTELHEKGYTSLISLHVQRVTDRAPRIKGLAGLVV